MAVDSLRMMLPFDYLKDREFAPRGEEWERKVSEWRQLYSDPDAKFDKEIVFHAEDIDPMVRTVRTRAWV